MIAILVVFGIASVVLVPLTRLLGARVFYAAALVPIAGMIHALALGPRVADGDIPFEAYTWIRPLGVEVSMRMDTLGWVMTLIVTAVGALVMIYCRNYFRGSKEGVGRFAGVLMGFAGAMYGLVLTDDLIVLVMFWEITSVLSYLLIGHTYSRAASRRAALQALLTTTLGGLVMFVGAVILTVVADTTSIDAILADPPTGALVDAALVCLLVGALSKSAIFPFHFWLPGAMAAPTPVSAYLHAAAMVKAGIYLLARFAPAFAEAAPWRPILVTLGIFTMLLGGLQALREVDLKRVLAYGTVSQLGFISVVVGFGSRDTALAGLSLVVAHAMFKAALFLIVGIIDRQLGTRDIDKLSGLGRQAPTLMVVSIIVAASMAGVPPLFGFVAKEAALTSLLDEATGGSAWAGIALIGIVIGSMLTTAYAIRFVWGAFARKKDAAGRTCQDTSWPDPPIGFMISPLALAAATLAAGLAASFIGGLLEPYADTAGEGHYHLALWHGLEPALGMSALAIGLGVVVFWLSVRTGWDRKHRLLGFQATDVYYVVTRAVDRLAVFVTGRTQTGSLPIYVGTIFVVLVGAEAAVLLSGGEWSFSLDAWQHPAQPIAAVLMIIAGIVAVRAQKRYTGVVLVSVTGLGMVTLFAFLGAPDLAVTQVLVESVTLVAFTLVLRRIPSRMGSHNGSGHPVLRAVIGIAVGATMAVVAVAAAGARIHEPVSTEWAELAYQIGHGKNVVNVALVDLRGWDTMGELSVLIAAATGVASLVYLSARGSQRQTPPPPRPPLKKRKAMLQKLSEDRRAWLIAGNSLAPDNRSIVVEVVVRLIFHGLFITSLYLLFAGHNSTGGGFAGGVVAGLALAARYLAGGREELDAAVRVDAGRLLGIGMVLAAGSALAPMLFGYPPLMSFWIDNEIAGIGHIIFVTSTIFDIGVYLIVIALVIDILRSLGSELDLQAEEEHLSQRNVAATVIDDAEIRGTTPVNDPITGSLPAVRRHDGGAKR
jgi:multicomponent Na+:H+ antiporter subunit A